MTQLIIYFVVSTLLTLDSLCQNVKEKNKEINGKCFHHHITGLIPARSGSKGIKDKNLSILGDESLLERSLKIINESGGKYYYYYCHCKPH